MTLPPKTFPATLVLGGLADGSATLHMGHHGGHDGPVMIATSGWGSSRVGYPLVRDASRTIFPAGWGGSVVGVGGTVELKIHVVSGAGAIPPTNGYGKPSVWLYTRYLLPPGAHTQSFGTQWASHWLRYITAAGVGDKTARGTPWVSRSPRELSPAGFDAMAVLESHVVGGTRHIFPDGTEMTQWGTRIIPEGKVTYPLGFAGEAGKPDVQLHTRYLRPQSFRANPDDLRFGRQDVWNLRQIVEQGYDPNDGLNPQPFGAWTGIENRNKEPVPVGWSSERFGYQFVWNKASPVKPTGIDAPLTGAGSVTHWRRAVVPDGIDSLASERWHATYNIADVLNAHGESHQDFGQPSLENRSRLYDKVGNFDSMNVGAPMAAERVRGLRIEERHTIEPPQINLPTVKLHTRYVEYVSAGDRLGAGSPVLDIRWTYITPRWAFHPPAFVGNPALRNVTPELRTGGANHEEFGGSAVRTEWRRVETTDGYMTQFGRASLRDRRSWAEFVTVGAPPTFLPGPKVTKVGGRPDAQYIFPNGRAQDDGGGQVPKPQLSVQSAHPEGFFCGRFGETNVTANSIRVEPGYADYLIGTPVVVASRRTVAVAKFEDSLVFQPSKPSVSPHTIYAVVEAPAQAKANNPLPGGGEYHYVGYHSSNRKDVGVPEISNKFRRVKPYGFTYFEGLAWPRPAAENALRYLSPAGINSFGRGLPSIPGTQEVMTFNEGSQGAVGHHRVAPPACTGPRTLIANGVPPQGFVGGTIDHYRREREPSGWDSLNMGGSLTGDKPYQWYGLHVGAPMPTIPAGFLVEATGEPWISLAVRDISVEGWSAFASEYDVDNFDLRMRVSKTAKPLPVQTVAPEGITQDAHGAPDIRRAAHYIRPDGNAEQYRKGAPQ